MIEKLATTLLAFVALSTFTMTVFGHQACVTLWTLHFPPGDRLLNYSILPQKALLFQQRP
jgi:hypothetical protein